MREWWTDPARWPSRFRRGTGELWRQFRRNRLAVIGLALIALFGVAALVPTFLIGTVWASGIYDPLTGYDADFIHPAGSSSTHLLGTDALGRDVLSMLLYATRPTWVLAVVAAITTALIGTLVGALGAYFRGIIDGALSRVSDAFLLLPAPIAMLVFGSGERSQDLSPAVTGLIYGIIAGVGAGAIVIRSQALKTMASPFIDAARVAGGGSWRIIARHVMPHLYPLAALFMMIAVVGAIVADGYASWLGQNATRLNWGVMVYYGVTFANPITGEPVWNAIIPAGIALTIFAMAFYLVSVGLREVADPRYKSARRRTVEPGH